jgi:integral membrane protein
MNLRALRLISDAEGFSLLALVLVAMPLKYVFALPLAVRVVGLVHGLLFLCLCLALLQLLLERRLSGADALRVLLWAFVPCGFLAVHRLLHARAPSGE